MAIRVALHHRTAYTYDRPIEVGPQVVRLRPTIHARTPVHSYSLQVSPEDHFCNWQQDPHGNFLARLVFQKPVKELAITVDVVFDLVVFNPFDFFLEESAEEFPFSYERNLAKQLRPCLHRQRGGDLFKKMLSEIDLTPRRSILFLIDVNQMVQQAVGYNIRMEPGIQTPEKTLSKGTGSCRDSAWLMCQLLRYCGLATRFVSGYLIQLVADKEAVDGPSGASSDFTDLHAWCEVYLPGAGWIGLDPTSGLLAGEGHIPLACSPSPSDAAPISGSHEKTKVTFAHEMRVERIQDSGRPLKPYAEDVWNEINDCGQLIDKRLQDGDVRLTTGGEPTFVSSRNPDDDQWNTAAQGREKQVLGDALLRRLQADWAPGALLHHGQGKWYPGEELPRWAYSCYWRRDGQVLWKDPDLFAALPERNKQNKKPEQMKLAQRLMEALIQVFAVDQKNSFAVYEDPWHLAWKSQSFPADVDPLKEELKSNSAQKKLTNLLRGDPTQAVALVLPLSDDTHGGWRSQQWTFKSKNCYLIPGDSPAGFRLPLDSLPWSGKEPVVAIPDPFAGNPLPRQQAVPVVQTPGVTDKSMEPDDGEEKKEPVYGAIVVEPRDGVVRVFLPPTKDPQAWIQLIAGIEKAASQTGVQVLLEGYEPPSHPDLLRLAMTPDPGVLEVNVPPVDTWDAFVEQTRSLYDHAHHLHLAAEKFDLDGKHTGTGGGAHVTIGGHSPADSPVLRRPDLLKSLLICFNNHPSLSYVFSGSFIGPTSQAPRIDEARQDSVVELELALQQIPDAGEACAPWLVDRLLRNILVDSTGNTHRTECCIDKLFSPDHSAGRQGLVEFRSFEMPPHWQLNCVQQLLIRSLIAYYWENPNKQELVRWGTELHDRWMLPWHLQRDLGEICNELRDHNIPIDAHWFQPHIDFRMPLLGSFNRDGVQVEIRQALEPWHVLGEESSAGAQARYVDSSLERVQVHVRGLTNRRHRITCNGVEVPLHPTGVVGEAVAGIRYRAWQPPHCLHPSIGVNVPLHIDLYDDWHQRALAACTVHVAHPGGLSYENRPINGNEAEGRRALRFQIADHTHGKYEVQQCPMLSEHAYTLDMRRLAK